MLQWDRGFQRAAPTALSGSRIKPPALPEVSDLRDFEVAYLAPIQGGVRWPFSVEFLS